VLGWVLGLGRAFRGGLMWIGSSGRRKKGWMLMSTTTVIRIEGFGDADLFLGLGAYIGSLGFVDDQV
jgi:hypothetical protein